MSLLVLATCRLPSYATPLFSLILDDLPAGEGGLSRTLARFAVEEAARGHDE